jgi:hypothetical protein
MQNAIFIRKHKLTFAILLYGILLWIIHMSQPAFIYDAQGSFRPFGVGYQNKTVVPIWLVCILLAILSYLAILWIVTL